MQLAVIDYVDNGGSARRFSPMLLAALSESRPWHTIRLVTGRDMVAVPWFDRLRGSSIKMTSVVTPNTLRRWFSDGRTLGVPGTWQCKRALRALLESTVCNLDRQIQKQLADADVLYYPWPDFDAVPQKICPTVVTVHDLLWLHLHGSDRRFYSNQDDKVRQWLLSTDTVIVAISETLREEILRFYPQTRRLEVIPQPAPILPPPLKGSAQQALLKRWGIQDSYALCPAGLWPHKNHENLLRAFAELKHDGQRLTLVCTGMYTAEAFATEDPEPNVWRRAAVLRQIAIDAGLKPGTDVIGLGFVNDQELATLYTSSTMVVMASVYEGGSFPLLEGASFGIPLACSDIPVYREQMEYYGLVPLYFDPREPASIAEAIAKRMHTAVSDTQLVEAASRVRARTWEIVAEEYWRVFEGIIE